MIKLDPRNICIFRYGDLAKVAFQTQLFHHHQQAHSVCTNGHSEFLYTLSDWTLIFWVLQIIPSFLLMLTACRLP
jgi:hypothetical protein